MSDVPSRDAPGPVVVKREHGLPYSKGLMAQSLMATGVPTARAYELARLIETRLGSREIPVAHLRQTVEEVLAQEEGERAVRRYRQWQRIHDSDRPLIVLLGGATGTGKSTVASLLAHRLGINRVVATDMVRHVMRACFDEGFMPAIHFSSFEVGAAVRLHLGGGEDADMLGFLRQVENVDTGVQALIARAIAERSPMIVEGVHLVPGLLGDYGAEALIVPAVLSVPDETQHRAHLARRGAGSSRRPAQRYLDQFDTIRKLQGFLTERAGEFGVPVVGNDEVEGTLSTLGELVLAALETRDPG
jgi:2-phosphoglycerate kinase